MRLFRFEVDDQAVSIAIATIELFKAKQARVIIVGGMASSSSWIHAMSYSTLFGRTRRTRKHAGHRNLLSHGRGRAGLQALSSGPRLRLLVKLQHQEAEQTRGQEGFQQ